MTERLQPRNTPELVDAIRSAVAARTPFEIMSRGTKRGLGRPLRCDRILDLSALSGIDLYEPEELVMTAAAGTPLAEIGDALAERRQQLAFEPPDLGPLLGAGAGQATIGGIFACNLSGSRRIKAGAARDHLLGFTAVSGRGEEFRAGGRVVKNVTGYDLPKLLTGSYGTLAAMASLTFKVLPAPETTRTLLLRGLDDASAIDALSRAAGSPFEVAGAAHLPAGPAARVLDGLAPAVGAATALRLEGFGPSVASRGGGLTALLSPFGEVELLDDDRSAVFWRRIRDVEPFVGDDRIVWRLSVPPADGAEAVAALGGGWEHYYDWGGGLIWIAAGIEAAGPDAGASRVRAAVSATSGHATLIRAPAEIRAAVDVFQPPAGALAALSRRVKRSFDPEGVLNPGRMYAADLDE